MKRILAILTLMLMLMPSLTKVWIWVDFQVNRQVIAATFCINKEKPITVCGGSCYLMKELNKADEPEDSQLPRSLKLSTEINYFLSEDATELLTNFIEDKTTHSTKIHSLVLGQYLTEIFHPPQYS